MLICRHNTPYVGFTICCLILRRRAAQKIRHKEHTKSKIRETRPRLSINSGVSIFGWANLISTLTSSSFPKTKHWSHRGDAEVTPKSEGNKQKLIAIAKLPWSTWKLLNENRKRPPPQTSSCRSKDIGRSSCRRTSDSCGLPAFGNKQGP